MRVSLVVPLLNEQASLRALHGAIVEAMAGMEGGWEVVYVDDGSTDGSLDVLREIYGADPHVKVLSFGRNLGKSAALATGFRESAGDVIVTMDADLQDDPREIPKLLAAIDSGYDLVSGWKRHRKDPLSKRLPSRVFNAVTSGLTGVRLHDMNCGLKAYRRSVVENIRLYGELHRYTPVLAHWAGFRVTEIEVTHHARAFGTSKFGIERFFRGFFDLMTVLFLQRYVSRPLHLFGMMGGVLFLGGFGIGVYLTVVKIMGEAIGRRPLLTLGILLMVVGVQFVSFGLLGEMIANLRGEGATHPARLRLVRDGGAKRGE